MFTPVAFTYKLNKCNLSPRVTVCVVVQEDLHFDDILNALQPRLDLLLAAVRGDDAQVEGTVVCREGRGHEGGLVSCEWRTKTR